MCSNLKSYLIEFMSLHHSCNEHCNDILMGAMAFQITGVSIVFLNVCSEADQKKTSKLRVTGLCEGNLPMTGELTLKMFPFDDVIINLKSYLTGFMSVHHRCVIRMSHIYYVRVSMRSHASTIRVFISLVFTLNDLCLSHINRDTRHDPF